MNPIPIGALVDVQYTTLKNHNQASKRNKYKIAYCDNLPRGSMSLGIVVESPEKWNAYNSVYIIYVLKSGAKVVAEGKDLTWLKGK